MEQEFSIQFEDYFAPELKAMQPLQNDGLVGVNKTGILVSATGRLLIRHICMIFDAHLQRHPVATDNASRYSRII